MHKLAKLMSEAEDVFGERLEKLEAACGYPSQDVRLLADNVHTARRKIEELGLDPDDTSADELYHALINRYRRDAAQIEEDFGASRANELAWHCLNGQEAWAIKSAVLKRELLSAVPVKTRKLLGFRSIPSLLKRCDIALILAIAKRVESETWRQNWQRMVKNLPATSIELRRISIVPADIEEPNANEPLSIVDEMGTVVVWQNADGSPPETLGQILSILSAAEKIAGHQLITELVKLHPALNWWSGNNHLVAWFSDEPVSFNIYDIAKDSNKQSMFEQRSFASAGQSMWQKLLDSYHKLNQTVEEVSENHQLAPALATEEFEDV